MVVMEVDIPEEKADAFIIGGKKRISYDAFVKKMEELEEAEWTDIKFDEPVPIEEFSAYLKKQIDG